MTKKKLFKELSIASLFSKGRTFTDNELRKIAVFRFDKGKYDPNTKFKTDISKPDCPIWYELRSDRNGRYLCLLTFFGLNNESERLDEIWKRMKL